MCNDVGRCSAFSSFICITDAVMSDNVHMSKNQSDGISNAF